MSTCVTSPDARLPDLMLERWYDSGRHLVVRQLCIGTSHNSNARMVIAHQWQSGGCPRGIGVGRGARVVAGMAPVGWAAGWSERSRRRRRTVPRGKPWGVRVAVHIARWHSERTKPVEEALITRAD